MLVKVDPDAFKVIYPRMGEEFPPSEMKPYDTFLSLLKEGKYLCLSLKEKETILGYCMGVATPGGFFFLDYLHVFKENQGKGYGSKILKELLSSSFAKEGIFLETEPLEKDEDYHSNKAKRMRFYDRFDIASCDFDYRFPCMDGTNIPLTLDYIPGERMEVDANTIKEVIRFAHNVIHAALPHKDETMALYFSSIKPVKAHRFELSKIDMGKEEEIKAVGRLIYHTDPYVYPDFFVDINTAEKVAKGLLNTNNVYNYKNILVGRINGEIAGFLTILDSYPSDNHKEMEKAFLSSIGYLPKKFEKVMEGYFDTLSSGWVGTQILSLSVLPEYRRLGVAKKMLNSLPKGKTYSLACVKDNKVARHLYERCGFEYSYEYPGYTGIPCVELVRRG